MSKSKVLLAFIGGAAAGAVLGFLFSSEKGSDIKKKVASKARDIADSILEKAEEMINDVEEESGKGQRG